MGSKVTVRLVCDACKKDVADGAGVQGVLAAARKRFGLALHVGCYNTLIGTADVLKVTRGRPRGSATRGTGRGLGRPKGSTRTKKGGK